MTSVENKSLSPVDQLKEMYSYNDKGKDAIDKGLFDALIEKTKDENGVITAGDLLIINNYINIGGYSANGYKLTDASEYSSHEEVLKDLNDENSTVSKDIKKQNEREKIENLPERYKVYEKEKIENKKMEKEKEAANIPEPYKSYEMKNIEEEFFLDDISGTLSQKGYINEEDLANSLPEIKDLKEQYGIKEGDDSVKADVFNTLVGKLKDEHGIITNGDMTIINNYMNPDVQNIPDKTARDKELENEYKKIQKDLKDENSVVSKEIEEQTHKEEFVVKKESKLLQADEQTTVDLYKEISIPSYAVKKSKENK